MIVSAAGPATIGQERVWGVPIFVLGGLQLLVVLDGTVVALALPNIRRALGLSEAGGSWIVTAYVLALGGLMLLCGRLGDTFGRKRVFTFGVGMFTLSSLLCGIAWDPAVLVGARALQGMAAAIAAPTSMALVATTYAPGKARSQAFAVFAALTGIGSVAGLIAGGVLTEISWRLVFLINVPIGVLVTVGALVCLRESTGERTALDVPGAILGTLGVTLAVFALNEAGNGPTRPLVTIPAIASVLLLAAFVLVERSAPNPLLPFTLFHNPNRVAALVAIGLSGAIMMCLSVFISMFLQSVLHYSPLQSGMSVLPFAVSLAVGATVSSRLVLRVQPRWLVMIACAIIAAGCVYAATIVDTRPAYFPVIVIAAITIGFGFGFAVIPLTLSSIAGVRPTDIGPLTALAQVAQSLGGALGLVAVGASVSARVRSEGGTTDPSALATDSQVHALALGYGVAFLCSAAIAAVTGLVVLRMRFTPEDIAEGQAAQSSAHAG
ncbi:MFS transporter [Nocardia sp. NBC_01503]|uniref:MFS transporter n=1 Tax=Nocardia sp. NBC_01503 TaxID=2975997 RepID=UPI002E7C17A3|nr:MFS transporter [Nocardia sp. NBC_01503]WTL31051.1 MFS transporter [Nocardia sp. NBC_01503]